MFNNIVLVAETGSDLTPALAEKYGIYLVPMHVQMGEETRDDGSFPPEDVCAYYDRTGKVPQTSASAPSDFETVFDEIHAKYPEKKILHLAYSAITTCSYQNAFLAAEDRDYVTSVDTKHVSIGQAAVVLEVAEYLKANPEATVEEAAAKAREIADRMQMCFIPKNLDYLRAGGRVSNAAYLGAKLLSLHPLIEILDGKLMSTKKYRGSMAKVVSKLTDEYSENLDPAQPLYLIYGAGLDEKIMADVESIVRSKGFENFSWVQTGCVIAAHSGPGAFGIVGFAK